MAKIVSFSLTDESYSELVSLQKQIGFVGKSETIRLAIKALSKENQTVSKLNGKINAILVITHLLDNSVTKAVHEYDEVVITHIHQHINQKCVEIFMLKGSAGKIKELFKKVSKTKSIVDIKLVTI